MNRILVYTKQPDASSYPDGLARSVHFSLERDNETVELNNGYGVLFARGSVREDGTIAPCGVRDPRICRLGDGSFLIRGVRVREDGGEEDNPAVISWRSADLIRFEEGPVEDEGSCIPGELCDSAELTDVEAGKLLAYWNTPGGKAYTAFPKEYSPADPVIFRWEDRWYFIFTNDDLNDIGLYVKEGESIEEVLSDDTPMHCILDVNEELGFIQNFWAPEFHVIGGELYILFAVSGTSFGPCCHMMKLKRGGRIIDPDSYETPVPVRRRDGSVLTVPEYLLSEEEVSAIVPSGETSVDDRFGISLDMTYLKDCGRSYMIWSFRQHIGTPKDSGSMLMIAEISEEKPWQLIADPVLLSRPLYGYENVRGTINNEGPYVYKRGDMIYVNYSGGAARGYLYMVNHLSAKSGSDLLDPASWRKRETPILNFKTWPEVYGPGHSSWFRDESGKEWIVFHATDSMRGRKALVMIYEYPEIL